MEPVINKDVIRKLIPVLSESEKAEIIDYHSVYEKIAEAFSEKATEDLKDHPVFGKIIRDIPKEVTKARNKLSRKLQEDAIVNSNWLPYIEFQIEQGKTYAKMGLDFKAWFEVVSLFKNYMRPYLIKEYGNAEELLSVLNGMNRFMDISMGIIGEAYIQEKEELILKDREKIRKLNEELEQKVIERTAQLDQNIQQLKESEEQIQTIFRNAPEAVIVIDEAGKIVKWNPRCEEIFGWDPNEVIGKELHEIIIPERFREAHQKGMKHFLKTKEGPVLNKPIEMFAIRKDGIEFDVGISISPTILNGKYNFIGFISDISYRKKAENLLKEYQHFFNHSNDLSCIANTEGYFEILNPNFKKVMGYSNDELIEHPFIEFVHPDDVASTLQEYEKLKSGSVLINFINRYRRKDGRYLWLDWNATPNLVTGKLYCIARNITEQVKSKELIEASQKKFTTFFYKSPVMNTISDAETGKITDVNYNFAEFLGLNKDEIIGRTSKELNLFVHLEHRAELINSILQKGFLKDELMEVQGANGAVKWVSASTDVGNINGKDCFLSAMIDVTERKEAEEKLLAVNKELEAFSYSVSHDLRAPLRAMNGYAKILQEDYAEKIDAEGMCTLQSILHNSKKMGELIDKLLAFSRLGRKEITTSDINMNTLVRTVCDENIINCGNEIEFNVAQLTPAKGDQALIRQVWINLISNAVKYSKHKPKAIIEIGSSVKDNRVEYYVKDNGAGFDMQYSDKLFGVFQRLHSEEEFEGTGIGLAIVQKIIIRHHGTVWAESKLNKGATFYFSLPNIHS